ncbi:MAG: DUF4340 domain-containing protein [SAR202 cluster bacterium]|jgi:hypothetical protein|nr:DUF4340 domain-containing protein [SAR202 cluster bacterium]MDP6300588.1 DUF4340 domain-containing protein [SAR202 cluster bacterium]MDP7102943.1 DUF4340 domain-containing protein [SAR202 cluster bacterium]MDP7225373.1 DUF4340 domain-containing protein [SAR202 cluster bacterium]MDP7414370.1 DUF4340 domain-containing protein [SAR202 cluster bacterium]|tara:strand:+ start:6651 stop:7607 length:957 start_codon:yes stop_codon:yes gene_type:complete
MKSKQLGYVLMALIAVGIAGLVFRVVALGSDETVLEGLVQVSSEASDKVVIQHGERMTELIRLGDTETGYGWFADDEAVFEPKLNQFWLAVSDFYDAQLVATNPANHTRMGVADDQGIEVSFFQDRRSLQEKLIVGIWKPDVRLCYVRRAGKDDVFGIPCAQGNTFTPEPDGWKNPVVAAIPPNEVESLEFTYGSEQFLIAPDPNGEWLIIFPEGQAEPANPAAINSVLGSLQLLLSAGFADDRETEGLNFAAPDAMVRINTVPDGSTPTTRLRFLNRDDLTLYLAIPSISTVFIVEKQRVAGLLLTAQDFLLDLSGR